MTKTLIQILLVATGLFFFSHASAGDDPNATPIPPAVPLALDDSGYQIIHSATNSENTISVYVLTEIEHDPDMNFCSGYNTSSCFFFIDETLVETAQFISFINGTDEKMFGLFSLVTSTVEFVSEDIFVFKTAFGDATFSSQATFCLHTATQALAMLESSSNNYDPETETNEQTYSLNLEAFCLPIIYPHQTQVFEDGKPF